MYCNKCGHEVPSGASSCQACLTKNSTETSENTGKVIGRSTLISAYIAAVMLPVIGLVVSLYFLFRHRVSHAIGIAATSMIFLTFWYAAFMSGPSAADFAWECEVSGSEMMQCQISNAGPGTGTLSFDIVAFCNTGEYRASVQTGQLEAGRVIQRAVRFEGIPNSASCEAIEYQNEIIR